MSTNLIQTSVINHLPSNRKQNSKGWISFNAICCQHNGETIDKRGRGGVITNPDGGISYSCFNCNFKTHYVPGYPLNYKFKKFLGWLGLSINEIQVLNFEAKREQLRLERLGLVKPQPLKEEIKVNFKKEPLPDESTSFGGVASFYQLKDSLQYPTDFIQAVEYLAKRRINMRKYEFYWSSDYRYKMNKRVIIPFTWKGEIIGYAGRAFVDGLTPKYIQHVDSGYIYNMDKQNRNAKFVIVSEGIFDAISVDGVAVLKSDVTKKQIDLLESLNREIIVVPDWNQSGNHLIKVAVDNGWSVSFPEWSETCTDINEAVQKYGRLFVMKSILDNVESIPLKIELKRRKTNANTK